MLRFTSEADFNNFIKGRKRRSNKTTKTSASVGHEMSAHAIALAQLAKNPDLRKGKQEHYLQVEVFDYFERKHPEIYKYLSAYPAGGHRSKKVGAEMKAEGQESGYPDIILDMPNGAYHGARFELKTEVGTLSEKQKNKLKELTLQGYYCSARRGFDAMVKAILDYYNLKSGEKLAHCDFDSKWLDA